MAEEAWRRAAAASCGTHQPPALLCGICPGIALLGGLGSATPPLSSGHVIRSLGHVGKGLGNGAKIGAWKVAWGGLKLRASWLGPTKACEGAFVDLKGQGPV